jgi:hypothetical protein
MKIKLTLLLLSFLLIAAQSPPARLAPTSPVQTQQSVPTPSGMILYTKNFQGGDLGARINAADKALGANRGWIVAEAGTISTQVRLNAGHKLKLGRGRFELVNSDIWTGSIVVESDTAIYGEGIDKTIIVEPEKAYICIVSAGTLESEQGHLGTGIRQNIDLAGFTVEGRNTVAEGGARSTILLGNAHRVHIYNVALRDTTCLGISAGGTGLTGKHAEDWIVEDCTFEGVASQNLNVVNGQRIMFRRNKFLRAGKTCGDGKACEGVTPIDIEPNSSSDVIREVDIEDNLIDSTKSIYFHGNGILVQNTVGIVGYGPVRVRRNRVIGGPLVPNFSGNIATGIYLARASNTLVSGNEIVRVGHAGIRLDGCSKVVIEKNTLVSTGTGGILSFEVMSTVDSRIAFNSVTVDSRSTLGRGLIVETGGSDRNVYEGNTVSEGINLVGKGSRIIK